MQIIESQLRRIVREEISRSLSVTNQRTSNGNPYPKLKSVSRSLAESRVTLSEGMRYHLDNRQDLDENVYRPGTAEFFSLFNEVRKLYLAGLYEATDSEAELLESDIGQFGVFEGKWVPLDFPMWDEETVTEASQKGVYSKGPGIVLSRLGGWSPVRQSSRLIPESEGTWAFIFPYFEPFLVGSTDDQGVTTGTDRPSRYQLMKRGKGKEPGLRLRKARYTGLLYTRIPGVPGSTHVDNGWYITDADSLRKYVFGRFRPDLFADAASSGFRLQRHEDMPRYSKDHFEVFVPKGKGQFTSSMLGETSESSGLIIPEAKYKGREVQLGTKGAKRSGGRAHVYVRDPKSGKVKKISFGSGMPDAMGDSPKHKARRKSFAARHGCAKNKNKMSASYWACRATKMFGRKVPGWW